MRIRIRGLLLGLTMIVAATAAVAPSTLSLAGRINDTTLGVEAAGRFELTFEGDAIRGFLAIEAPLDAGRWPIEGTRRGAWCEIVVRQTSTTRLVFRGVLNGTGMRGTFIRGGGGELVRYGRFHAAVEAPAR